MTAASPTPPEAASPADEARRGHHSRRGWLAGLGAAIDWIFGLAALVGALAAFSVIPLLNFLSLGYLLHVSGTVAKTGRLRDGFIGVRKASALGSAVAGIWLVLWPARLLAEVWRDADLIAQGSPQTAFWRGILIAVSLLTLAHIAWAFVRGGRLWHFLWPAPLRLLRWLRSPDKSVAGASRLGAWLLELRLPFYFWLGLRGFVGALAWLIVPVGLLLVATQLPTAGALLVSLPSLLLLTVVAVHLPFLQAHFAATGRLAALFEWREVRARFRRAPLAFWIALLVTLLFAIPLYLLKIELTPKELAWAPSVLFVILIFPARLLTGWATHRSLRRDADRHWTLRWLGRLAIVPVAVAYGVAVFLNPFISWNGIYSLLEQHAFLVPAPLMAL